MQASFYEIIMYQAQRDAIYNSMLNPYIFIWNMDPWLQYKGLQNCKYIFVNLEYADLFTLTDQFFFAKDLPYHLYVRVKESIKELKEQDATLKMIREEIEQDYFVPFDILLKLQKFLPKEPIPLLGDIPNDFMYIFEMALEAIPWLQSSFERRKCQMMVFGITMYLTPNMSFAYYELPYMNPWDGHFKKDFVY